MPEDASGRQPRVPFIRPVWMGSPDSTGPMRRLWAGNLSKGGMFVRTREPPIVGTKVLVALDGVQEILPLAEGIVVWSRPQSGEGENAQSGAGIAFEALKPDVGLLLDTLVEAGGFRPRVPPRASVAWTEPKTPVLQATAGEELRTPPGASVFIPNVGLVHLSGGAGELQIEFDVQEVDFVETYATSLKVRFR